MCLLASKKALKNTNSFLFSTKYVGWMKTAWLAVCVCVFPQLGEPATTSVWLGCIGALASRVKYLHLRWIHKNCVINCGWKKLSKAILSPCMSFCESKRKFLSLKRIHKMNFWVVRCLFSVATNRRSKNLCLESQKTLTRQRQRRRRKEGERDEAYNIEWEFPQYSTIFRVHTYFHCHTHLYAPTNEYIFFSPTDVASLWVGKIFSLSLLFFGCVRVKALVVRKLSLCTITRHIQLYSFLSHSIMLRAPSCCVLSFRYYFTKNLFFIDTHDGFPGFLSDATSFGSPLTSTSSSYSPHP